MGKVREFDLLKFRSVDTAIASKSNSDVGLDSVNYTLELVPNEGEALKLSEMTTDYRQIAWIAARLMQELETQQNS